MVHVSTGMNAPASEQLLSEPAIVARLAHATLPHSRVPWLELIAHYDRIRDLIEKAIPGFEDFNARVRVPGGFHLRNAAREREWRTPSGRARLIPHALAAAASPAAAGAEIGSQEGRAHDAATLQLMTVRSHDQYNTTVYGLDDRYRGVDGERRPLFISRGDLARLCLSAGERVDLVSVWHDGEREAHDFLLVEYAIPAGCVASYFPETNALVPLDHVAERAGTPASKSIPVRLRRRDG
jgi:anaerobic selenocysteine-containing dehydrogenase